MNEYFVYTHSINGTIFYVGSGKIRPIKRGCWTDRVKFERAYMRSCRSRHWRKYVGNRDFSVVIYNDYKDKDTCLQAELSLINQIGTIHDSRGPLVNVIAGEITYQFDMTGKLIGEYKMIREASDATGIDRSSITNCILGNRYSAGGYLWSHNNRISFPEAPIRLIIQETLTGEVVNVFNGLGSAARHIGTSSRNAIRNVFIGKQKQAYGFKWRIKYESHPVAAKQLGLSESRLK